MKRISISGWAMLTVVAACVVIPASAQVPPQDRGDRSDAPHYVDSADYDPQPYYVDGVQYKPYVPEKKKAKPAADSVKAAPAPVTPDAAPAPGELHPFVPQQAPTVAADDAAPKAVASSSSSSNTPYVAKKRPRYAVAIIEALDKVTAESVRFEAPLGKPIRYKGLIYTVKACETTADDEAMSDVMAYVRVRTNPVAATSNAPAVKSKEVFRGWTFASTPSLNPIQHPVYDAWVIGCRKPLGGATT